MNRLKRIQLFSAAATLAGALALTGCGTSTPNQTSMDSNPYGTEKTSGYSSPGDNSNVGTNGTKTNSANTNDGPNGTGPGNVNANGGGAANPGINPSNTGSVTGPGNPATPGGTGSGQGTGGGGGQ
jgi:hypothetical protein